LENLWNGLVRAVELIITFDPEVMQIAGRSLMISVSSTVIASVICIPVACIIHFNEFRGKRFIVVGIIQTLYSVPTVAVGLFVFVFIWRPGHPFHSHGYRRGAGAADYPDSARLDHFRP